MWQGIKSKVTAVSILIYQQEQAVLVMSLFDNYQHLMIFLLLERFYINYKIFSSPSVSEGELLLSLFVRSLTITMGRYLLRNY